MRFSVVLFLAGACGLQAQPVLRWSRDVTTDKLASVHALATDAGGNVRAAGARPAEGPLAGFYPFVVAFDRDGNPLADATGPRFSDNSVGALALDPLGHLYVGSMGQGGSFVTRLDPSLSTVEYAVQVPGVSPITALAVGVDGSVWVAGAGSASAPYSTRLGPSDAIAGTALVRLSPDGVIIGSTWIGASRMNCAENFPCQGTTVGTGLEQRTIAPLVEPRAIALGAAGDVYVAGWTNAIDLPVTPAAPQVQCRCVLEQGNAFALRLNPAGTSISWLTYLGGGGELVAGIALDPAGNSYIAGTTPSAGFPATPGAFQTQVGQTAGETDAFAVKFTPEGSLVYATFLGGHGFESGQSIAADPQGRAYVTGETFSSDFPLSAQAYARGLGFLTILEPNGAGSPFSTMLPHGTGGYRIALGSGGALDLLGPTWLLSRFDLNVSGARQVFGMANAAYGFCTGRVAPGELLSLYGSGLDGGTVLFDGTPAPVLYAGSDQINTVVPFSATGKPVTRLQLVREGQVLQDLPMAVVESAPEIFHRGEDAAALNEDMSVNSVDNPARAGSFVALYATGAGVTEPPSKDGALAVEPYPMIRLPVSVDAGGSDAPVQYAGAAPGIIAGVVQVNARLPQVTGTGVRAIPVVLRVGEAMSGTAWVWVAP